VNGASKNSWTRFRTLSLRLSKKQQPDSPAKTSFAKGKNSANHQLTVE
jgi:hypothetical protein